jgi:hypothetical protein
VYGKACGTAPRAQEFPCDFFLYMKDLVYSISIDTTEVLREQVENAATPIHNNKGMLERVEK